MDSRNLGVENTNASELNWPHPHCLLVSVEDAPRIAELDPMRDAFFVFEYTSPIHSALDAIREVVLTARRTAACPVGPLLFLGAGADVALTERYLKGAAGPSLVNWTVDEEGDLLMLHLDKTVVSNPLFWLFFANMVPQLGPAHSEVSLKMLRSYLGEVPHD